MTKMEKSQKVCELYLDGKTKKEIAEAVNCSINSIGHYLRLGGIRRQVHLENAMPMIIKMRKDNKTLKEISDATGFNMQTISKVLNKRGLGYKGYNLDYSEPEIDTENLIYAERKPQTHKVEYEGKKYLDVTELFGI